MRAILLSILIISSVDGFGQDSTSANKTGTISIGKKDEVREIPADTTYQVERSYIMLRNSFGPSVTAFSDTANVIEEPIFSSDGITFGNYISQKMKYPKMAVDSNISGVVSVTFLIDQYGYVRNPRVTKGIGGGCDKEAVRLMKSSPRWTPAKLNGSPLDARVNKEINFQIE